MADVLKFIAANDVGIGIVGTLVVILGVVTGYGRQHRRGMDRYRDDDRR